MKFLVTLTSADSFPWAGSPWLVEEVDHETLIQKFQDSGLTIIEEDEIEDPLYPEFETPAGNLLSFTQINMNEGLPVVLNYIKSADKS